MQINIKTKDIKPKGLFNRFALIIVLPTLILLTITTYIFYQRHWDSIATRIHTILIDELFIVVYSIENGDTKLPELLHFSFACQENMTYLPKVGHSYKVLAGKTASKLGRDVSIQTHQKERHLSFYMHSPSCHNHILKINCPIQRLESKGPILFMSWLFGTAMIVLIVSMLFMKNQVQAIIDLSHYANCLGKGQDIMPIKAYGAKEVKRLAVALKNMKARIQRQVKYRANLLSHISHDLRTPLTRINLNLEMIKNSKYKSAIIEEIKEMNELIHNYLNFAKEEGSEKSYRFNFTKLLLELHEDFKSHSDILFIMPTQIMMVNLKFQAVKRALTNVIENAIKYHESQILFKAEYKKHFIVIDVEDDGCGIPKEHHKKVFEPFEKIGTQDGFGLGLAIVKSIIYGHGGKIKLSKSKLGGLNFKIIMPV